MDGFAGTVCGGVTKTLNCGLDLDSDITGGKKIDSDILKS